MDKPYPGSAEALKNGCKCAVMDNGYGKGYLGDGEKYGWWVSGDCPIHGAKEPETENKEKK